MAAEPAVLVTRPAGQAAPLLDALTAAGFRAHHQPLLALAPLEELSAQSRQALQELDRYQHVIFISVNAVRFGLECIDDYWPQLPVGLHWYAVGSSTASLLAQRGLNPITPEKNMSSEGLLALPGLQSVSRSRVLIVKGLGGRSTLRDGLLGRGARVDELACYRRYCPALAPGELAQRLLQWDIRAIALSSGDGLSNLLTLLSAEESTKFRDIVLIVPSRRVEQFAREAGFGRVVVAANASDDAVLAALQHWQSGEY